MNNKLTYEKAFEKLEKIILELENNELELEESILKFKEGVQLYNYLSELLNKAEMDVKILIDGDELNFPGDTNEI